MALRKRSNRPVRLQIKSDEDVMTTVGRPVGHGSEVGYAEKVLESLKITGRALPSASRYELVDKLGEGGMGAVFLAHHVSAGGIRKQVAVKVLKDSADEEAIQRFVDEAQLLAQLSQGTVVELLALERLAVSAPLSTRGRPGRQHLYFMVQEYIKGPSLEDVLQTLHENVLLMIPPIVGHILNKTAISLAEAHTLTDDAGKPLELIHRDISPSNILFNARAGITKLADFGVARAFGDIAADGEPRIVGKPRYMAPEQLEGRPVTASDIWALGVIGYECMTGFAPYRVFGDDLHVRVENLLRQQEYRLRPPAEVLRCEEGERFDARCLSDIIMRCLEPDPARRPDANQLTSMLEGEFLYGKGLGPTNKTLSAYLRLLEYSIGGGEIIPPSGYAVSEDAKVLMATLWVDNPLCAFRRRSSRIYDPEFVQAVKAQTANPCLDACPSGVFAPVGV